MAVNLELVKQLGIDEDTVGVIEAIHNDLEFRLYKMTLEEDMCELVDHFRKQEFRLQALWGFPQDHRYHTWVKRLHKRTRELAYVGAVYRCKVSGESRTIDKEALESGILFGVGHGFIDFGGVVRIVGNLERVK